MANPIDDILNTLSYDGSSDEKKAKGYLDTATGAFNDLNAPDLKPLSLEDFAYEGDVDPRLLDGPANVSRGPDLSYHNIDGATADLATQGDSEMKNISSDPRLRDYQMRSLAALKEVADGNGLTAQDEAALNKVRNQASRDDMGRRGSILQGMHERGQSGSGNELLAQLASGQAATDRESEAGLDIAGQAQARKLAAIQNLGQSGGQLRDQDFSEASRVAAAQDAINNYNTSARNTNNQFNAGVLNSTNQFNTANTLDTDRYNSAKNIDASKFDINNQFEAARQNNQTVNNLAVGNRDARQGVKNNNTNTHNTQQSSNQQLPQQNFDNNFKIAGGKASAAGQGVAYYGQKQQTGEAAKGNMYGALIGGGALIASDERVKKDVHGLKDSDIDDFLASIDPKEFKYKDQESYGEGKRPGVMAQDLEKSKLGALVVDEDENGTKGLDRDKTMGLILAALSHVAKKVK